MADQDAKKPLAERSLDEALLDVVGDETIRSPTTFAAMLRAAEAEQDTDVATDWDAPTAAQGGLPIVAQVTLDGSGRLPRVGRRRSKVDEMPTDELPAVKIGQRSFGEDVADQPTASALEAIQGVPVVTSRKPKQPTRDTGTHRPRTPADDALARVMPLVPWSPADRLLAAKLQQSIIGPNAAALAAGFFEAIRKHELGRIFLGRPEDQARLVGVLEAHLARFAEDPLSEAWVDARLRIGRAHARIGLPLGLYLGACHHLEALIGEAMPESLSPRRSDGRKVRDLLRRLMALEQALVSHAFHSGQVDALNDAIREQAQAGFKRSYGAQLDPVTLLARPPYLRHQLQVALDAGADGDRGCALVALALDGLDEAAWHRGFGYRDAILAETGARVRATLRGADVAGIEPDGKVLAVLTRVRANEVTIVAERLRRAVEDVAYTVEDHTFRQKAQVGVALPGAREPAESVVARALADLAG